MSALHTYNARIEIDDIETIAILHRVLGLSCKDKKIALARFLRAQFARVINLLFAPRTPRKRTLRRRSVRAAAAAAGERKPTFSST